MRVAFVIPGKSGGGVRSVVRIAHGLAERGHALRILFREHDQTARDVARSVYLRLRYGGRGSWLSKFPGETRPFAELTPEAAGINDVIVGVGVDCVLKIASLPIECGVKVHNSRGVEPWIAERMNEAWSLVMPRIVVGEHLVEKMRRHGSNDAIYVAHNGVDRREYFPSAHAAIRAGVGTVYHGGDVKDPELILGVLNELHARRPELPLSVFGSFPRPRRLPRIATYVRLPSTAQARDVYSTADVWFLCSRNEGLPNPLLEAMACGCAVVSTDCGGASDIIAHEQNGLIVPTQDQKAMSTAIFRLLDDVEIRRGFVSASSATLDAFTWPRAIEAFEAALLDIVDSHRTAKERASRELSEVHR